MNEVNNYNFINKVIYCIIDLYRRDNTMVSCKRLLKSHRFKRFYDGLEKIYDFRMRGKVKHRLSDCLIVIILATMSGCNIFREFVAFAKRYENRFRKLHLLDNGVPSHDTLERVMHQIKHSDLEKTLMKMIARLIDYPEIVSLDGKYIRATRDSSKESTSACNIVTLYDVVTKTPILSRKVAKDQNKKGGEQGAIEFLLKRYHRQHPRKKLIISIDGVGANRSITMLCKKLKYDFVINIKREEFDGLGGIIKDDFLAELQNEKYSSRLVKKIIQNQKPIHGRLEKRKFYMIDDLSYIKDRYGKLWKGIKSIGMMRSEVLNIKKNKVTIQDRFFITSDVGIDTFSNVRRKHWNIEAFHYILDNSFKEDRCTLRKGLGAINLNLIRKFIYMIVQLSRKDKSFDESRSENRYLTPQELLYKILYVNSIKTVQ